MFDDDEQVQSYVKSGKARLVSGDALKSEDVSKAWQTALDAGQGKADYALFTIGLYHSPPVPSRHVLIDRYIPQAANRRCPCPRGY